MLTVFLDQNHWIALSRAYYGKAQQPDHVSVLEWLARKTRSAEVILPLQIGHLVEFNRCNDAHRRQRMALVFEEFSQRWFFAPWSEIVPYELSVAVASTFGAPETVPKPEFFGRGVLFAAGAEARKAIAESQQLELGVEFHAALAACPGALFDLLTFANEDGRKRQLASDNRRRQSYAQARERGRDPHDTMKLARRVEAAAYTFEHQNELQRRLIAAGKSFRHFVALGPEGMSAFFDRVASLDVDRSLGLYRDRQWTRSVEGNDLNDLGYLALAVPYCDAVVVENFWGHAIRALHLDSKYNTRVYTDLAELVDLLSQ